MPDDRTIDFIRILDAAHDAVCAFLLSIGAIAGDDAIDEAAHTLAALATDGLTRS
jgi:hypothetical protein